jgi:hypothetical protein
MSADVIVLALVHIQANATTATVSREGGVTLSFWRFGEPPRIRVGSEWTFWGNLVETPVPPVGLQPSRSYTDPCRNRTSEDNESRCFDTWPVISYDPTIG